MNISGKEPLNPEKNEICSEGKITREHDLNNSPQEDSENIEETNFAAEFKDESDNIYFEKVSERKAFKPNVYCNSQSNDSSLSHIKSSISNNPSAYYSSYSSQTHYSNIYHPDNEHSELRSFLLMIYSTK